MCQPDVCQRWVWELSEGRYRAERHYVATKDNYRIVIHRLVHNSPPRNRHHDSSSEKDKQRVVFFLHALLESSVNWVLSGTQNLPFQCLDSGHDIWLGNSRGNLFTTDEKIACTSHCRVCTLRGIDCADRHMYVHPWSCRKVTRGTLVDMALFDIPAMLNYIRTFTMRKRVTCVGVSQGAAQLLIHAACWRPGQYDKRLSSTETCYAPDPTPISNTHNSARSHKNLSSANLTKNISSVNLIMSDEDELFKITTADRSDSDCDDEFWRSRRNIHNNIHQNNHQNDRWRFDQRGHSADGLPRSMGSRECVYGLQNEEGRGINIPEKIFSENTLTNIGIDRLILFAVPLICKDPSKQTFGVKTLMRLAKHAVPHLNNLVYLLKFILPDCLLTIVGKTIITGKCGLARTHIPPSVILRYLRHTPNGETSKANIQVFLDLVNKGEALKYYDETLSSFQPIDWSKILETDIQDFWILLAGDDCFVNSKMTEQCLRSTGADAHRLRTFICSSLGHLDFHWAHYRKYDLYPLLLDLFNRRSKNSELTDLCLPAQSMEDIVEAKLRTFHPLK